MIPRSLHASMRPAPGLVLTTVVCILLLSCSQEPRYPAPLRSGQDVVIDISALRAGEPTFFTHRAGGKNVDFFVFMMNRQVLSFADACTTCYAGKKGYQYEDGVVVCRACSQRFPLQKLEKGIGGCYPIRLDGRVAQDGYHIPLAALEALADKF